MCENGVNFILVNLKPFGSFEGYNDKVNVHKKFNKLLKPSKHKKWFQLTSLYEGQVYLYAA